MESCKKSKFQGDGNTPLPKKLYLVELDLSVARKEPATVCYIVIHM